jgi:hypothetical protein
MEKEDDRQREAEAAMKQAVLADGLERQRWIQMAQGLAGACPHASRSEPLSFRLLRRHDA